VRRAAPTDRLQQRPRPRGVADGVAGIPIETRHADEVHWLSGVDTTGRKRRVRITPEGSAALNPAFDVTPARLVSAIITESGAVPANREGVVSAIVGKGQRARASRDL
jgi:methylthioribose-1-phosphate isomerase